MNASPNPIEFHNYTLRPSRSAMKEDAGAHEEAERYTWFEAKWLKLLGMVLGRQLI